MQSNVVATMEALFHANPLTQLWWILEASWILRHSFLEFFKLAKIAVVQMLGLVENKQTFFILSFMKCKLGNHFNEHLNDVVGMYFQTLTIWIFSHMTHVLKIGRNRSPCRHWIKLFYWDLGGVCCLIPSSMGHSQWWHLIMVKTRSFCHLEVKIQKLWWLFNVVCVCVFPLLILLLSFCPVSRIIFVFIFLASTFACICFCLHLSISIYLSIFISTSIFSYFPLFASIFVQCVSLSSVYLCLDFACVCLYLLTFVSICRC